MEPVCQLVRHITNVECVHQGKASYTGNSHCLYTRLSRSAVASKLAIDCLLLIVANTIITSSMHGDFMRYTCDNGADRVILIMLASYIEL